MIEVTLRVAKSISEWRPRPGTPAPIRPLARRAMAARIWRPRISKTSELAEQYNPFISHEFLSSLESSQSVGGRTGWQPQHLLAEDTDGTLVGAVPCYLKSHSRGEYVFDRGWAEAYERAGGSYYPKLQVSVPFTPATGRRLLVRPAPSADAVREALMAGLIDALPRAPRPRRCTSPSCREAECGPARRARLPAAHRPAVPLGQCRLRDRSTISWRRSPRASARRSGASGARRSPPASPSTG